MKLNSKGPYPTKLRKRKKIRLCLFTFFIKYEIQHFHVVQFTKKVICLLNLLVCRGCLHEKTRTGARVSYRDDLLISYRAYMMLGHFISRLFEGTLHVDKIHVPFKIANVMHALPVPVHPNSNLPSMIATKTLLLMVMWLAVSWWSVLARNPWPGCIKRP